MDLSSTTFTIALPHYEYFDFKNDHKELGIGGEAIVYRSHHKKLGYVAIKKFFIGISLEDKKEIDMLVKIKHPNILQIFGIIYKTNKTHPCGYVMEYMERGSLHSVIHDSKLSYDMQQIYSWIYQTSLALDHLHDNNIIHRDVKPRNILLGYTVNHLKLADFGFARETTTTSITRNRGTVCYMAPEVINSSRYGKPADVYSFTLCIWEMIHRRKPYDDTDGLSYATLQKIIKGDRPIIDSANLDREFETLLKRGWALDPTKRFTIAEIVDFSTRRMKSPYAPHHQQAVIYNRETVAVTNGSAQLPALMKKMEVTAATEAQNRPGIAEIVDFSTRRMNSPFAPHHQQAVIYNRETVAITNGRINRNVEVQQAILVMGGKRGNQCLDEILILNKKNSEWKKLPLKLPFSHFGGGSVLLNSEIYFFGGQKNAFGGTRHYKLNTQQMTWIELASMNETRNEIGNNSLVYQECIWVFGGQGNGRSLCSVEKYCPKSNTWTYMRSLPEARKCSAAAVLNGKFFVCGGYDINSRVLKSVTCFDPITEVWSHLTDMPSYCRKHSIVPYGNSLLVMGGGTASFAMNTVWSLDLNGNNPTWTELQPMKEKRRSFSAVSFGNEICVIGGRFKEEDRKGVEIFDGISDWRNGPDLPSARWGATAVVIPSHIADILQRLE